MTTNKEILHYFNLTLGQLSIKEIIINQEMIQYAKKIKMFFQENKEEDKQNQKDKR